jgi:transposase
MVKYIGKGCHMSEHHSKEFKKEAVRLVIQSGRKIKQIAEELRVNPWTIKGWVKKYDKEARAELISQGLKMSPEEENRLLKKELADVSEERDILKKAIAVFSKKPKTNMPL